MSDVLLSSGSEGRVKAWKTHAKGKVGEMWPSRQLPAYLTKISSSGLFVAVALTYDYHKGYEGMKECPKENVLAIRVLDSVDFL